MTHLDLFNPDEYLAEFKAFLPSVAFSDRNPLNTEMFFLWCMIRTQRPALFIESGTFRGYSASFICEALARNDDGAEFITIGFNLDDCLPYARERLAHYPFAQVVEADSREYLAARGHEQRHTAFFIDGPKGCNMFPLFKVIERHFNDVAFIAVHDCERESTSYNRKRVRQFFGLDHPILFCDTTFQTRYQDMDEPLIGRSELADWRPFHFKGAPRESYGSETAYVLRGRELTRPWPQPIRRGFRTLVCDVLRGHCCPTPAERSE
jgi:predicted O-methyltransferase YrrM